MKPRVLVCDDERHIVRLIQANLQRQGYEVVACYSGAEALELVKHTTFDFAVIDEGLGDMSGPELEAKLRADPKTAEIRIRLLKR